METFHIGGNLGHRYNPFNRQAYILLPYFFQYSKKEDIDVKTLNPVLQEVIRHANCNNDLELKKKVDQCLQTMVLTEDEKVYLLAREVLHLQSYQSQIEHLSNAVFISLGIAAYPLQIGLVTKRFTERFTQSTMPVYTKPLAIAGIASFMWLIDRTFVFLNRQSLDVRLEQELCDRGGFKYQAAGLQFYTKCLMRNRLLVELYEYADSNLQVRVSSKLLKKVREDVRQDESNNPLMRAFSSASVSTSKRQSILKRRYILSAKKQLQTTTVKE